MQRDEAVLAVGIAEAARRLGLSIRTVATLVARQPYGSFTWYGENLHAINQEIIWTFNVS
jgi:hypothetical protein